MNKDQRKGIVFDKFSGWRESHINHEDRIAFGLTLTEYAVIDYIHRCTNHVKYSVDGWTKISYAVIGRFFSMSRRGAMKLCQRLEEREFLILKDDGRKKATDKWIEKRYDILTVDLPDLDDDNDGGEESSPSEQSSPPTGEQSSSASEQSSPLNNKLKDKEKNELEATPNSPSSSFSIDSLTAEKLRQVENRIRAKIKSREILEIIGDSAIDVPTMIEKAAAAFVDYDTQGYDDGNQYSVNKMLKYVRKVMVSIAKDYEVEAEHNSEGQTDGQTPAPMNIYERCDYVFELFGRILRRGHTPDKDVFKSEYYLIKKLIEEGETLEGFEEVFTWMNDRGASEFMKMDFAIPKYSRAKEHCENLKQQSNG